MMSSQLPQFTIRIDKTILDKLKYIADYNARSANREIEVIIKRHIINFELEHGTIDLN